MIYEKYKKLIFVVTALAVLLVYQNCSFQAVEFSSLEDQNRIDFENFLEQGGGNGDGFTGLDMPTPQTLAHGASFELMASGGAGPYAYSIESGPGSIVGVADPLNSSLINFYFNAPASAPVGTVSRIRVTDSLGRLEFFDITYGNVSVGLPTKPSINSAQGWVNNLDYEVAQVGQSSDGANAFTDAFSFSLFATSPVHSGNYSSVLSIQPGDNGYGEFGGISKFQEVLTEGDEIWVKAHIYLPAAEFDSRNNTGGLSMFNISVKDAKGGSTYLGVSISNTSDNLNVMNATHRKTFTDYHDLATVPNAKQIGDSIVYDDWQSYEMYVKFDSNAGNGIFRVWQNGNLIFEDLKIATLPSATAKALHFQLFGWWSNEGPTEPQTAYVDDMVVTTRKPTNTDSAGNLMIGE